MKIQLPHIYAVNQNFADTTIQQISQPTHFIEADLANYVSLKLKGKVIVPQDNERILLLEKNLNNHSFSKSILTDKNQTYEAINGHLDLSHCGWLKHPHLKEGDLDFEDLTSKTLESWENAFSLDIIGNK